MPGTIDILRSRWQETVDQLTAMQDRATNEDRELTEGEQANSQLLRARESQFRTRIGEQVELERSVTSTQDLLRSLPMSTGGPVPSPPAGLGTNFDGQLVHGIRPDAVFDGEAEARIVRSIWSSPGEYMHDIIHSHMGDMESRERIARAIQNNITSDVPGLVPTPIVGELVNIIDASRPIVAALRSYSMPPYGSSFTRPKVVQHTLVGEQTAQKTELPSRKLTVNPITVNKMTLGGAIDVAFQVIDWTSPSALNAISTDLADQYAIQTETVAAGLITAAGTANTANAVPVATADAKGYITAIATAAGKVYSGCKRFPDMIIVSPDQWATLASITDTTGRPIMMAGAPMNSAGGLRLTGSAGSVLGLNLVVSPALPPKSMFVVCSAFAEVYEDQKGALRVVEPKLLGWEIAYYGYFAGIVTENSAFVQLTPIP
jgi:HK97 family phage major capsid protein